jgi:hypothetical protein
MPRVKKFMTVRRGVDLGGTPLDDKVVLDNKMYLEIFGHTRVDNPKARPWQKRVVRIRVTEGVGVTEIRRRFYGGNSVGVKANTIGLDLRSCIELGIPASSESPLEFELSAEPFGDFAGSVWFYWFHPVDSTRVSFKLGLVGALAGILGMLVSAAAFIC